MTDAISFITLSLADNVIKHFTAVIYKSSSYARVFVLAGLSSLVNSFLYRLARDTLIRKTSKLHP
jgi:hypothetical protein